MHSCGHIDPIFQNVIDTGVDTWRGQSTAVDRPALVAKYGDQFKFGAEIRPAPGASDEEVLAAVKEFKETYAGKNVWIALSVLMPKEQVSLIIDALNT